MRETPTHEQGESGFGPPQTWIPNLRVRMLSSGLGYPHVVEHHVREEHVKSCEQTRNETTMTMNATPVERSQSPAKATDGQDERTRKGPSFSDRPAHSKRLSLNLPVLLSQPGNAISASPNTATPISPAKSSPRKVATPVVETPDFLTLLAGQERKVLELRDELSKAESELLALKKQWANFEASKKKSELRQIAKLQPIPSGSGKDSPETEQERARILEQTSGKPRRHTSQRVFSSSRHARQLSLLSPTATDTLSVRHSLDSSVSSSQALDPTPLSRADTIPTPAIDSPKALGKTYRDLANRNSGPLQPPNTDAIMRQGKQMASDLKDGLWTFFEDIRQATVGEEAITGIQGQNGRPKMAAPSTTAAGTPSTMKRSSNTLHRKKRFSLNNSNDSVARAHSPHTAAKISEDDSTRVQKDTSFWREFGVDTPHKDMNINNNNPSDPPPPLLDGEDEAWDAWESPKQQQQQQLQQQQQYHQAQARPSSLQAGTPAKATPLSPSERMPWPELSKRDPATRKNTTPGKVTRTVSDMMREWEDGDPEKGVAVERRQLQQQQQTQVVGLDHHVLSSPHM